MSKGSYPKIGIALGGGGAKGFSHIGVLKTLEKYDIPVHFIAGTSIGAFIGAYYAAYPSFEKLEELIYNFNRKKGLLLFDPILRGGFISGNKIEKFIIEMLDGATFKTLRIPFSAVATDIQTAEEVIISQGDLVKAVQASISIPAIFQPVQYYKRWLSDGGLSDPVPVNAVRAMGSDIVIAVNVESSYFREPVTKIPSLARIPIHSVNVLRHNLTLQSLKTADVIVSPNTPPIGLVGWEYFFDKHKAQKMMKLGEEAVEKSLPDILETIEQYRSRRRGLKRIFHFLRKPLISTYK